MPLVTVSQRMAQSQFQTVLTVVGHIGIPMQKKHIDQRLLAQFQPLQDKSVCADVFGIGIIIIGRESLFIEDHMAPISFENGGDIHLLG